MPTCPVAACNALRGTRSKPKPALVVKNFRKLWSTNWRIKPSVSLEAPNPTSPPPRSSPCSRLFATPRLQVFLLIEILPSTSSNTSAIPACPFRASPLLFGKPKGWCPLQGSPYTSSSHTPSDVLPTLTSPRWLCITLIYNTPLDKPWPLVIMKTLSGTATKRPVDIQNVSYHCSGYRLLHWSPRLAAGSNKLPPDDVCNVIRVAAALSYYVARQVRRNQESSKLLILTPHNNTVDDLLDALGLPPDNLPPSLYEFYLVMIYRQQILPYSSRIYTHRP